jgi:hypothetical protein
MELQKRSPAKKSLRKLQRHSVVDPDLKAFSDQMTKALVEGLNKAELSGSTTPSDQISPVVKYSELGPKKAFFRSEGDIFVVDIASERMFRMDGVNLNEITALDIKLKVSLEGAIMDENASLGHVFVGKSPPPGFLASS